MADYVRMGASQLDGADLRAIWAHLRSVPAIERPIVESEEPLLAPEAHDEAPIGGAPLGSDVAAGAALIREIVTSRIDVPQPTTIRVVLVVSMNVASLPPGTAR